jgi:hypothetical protein
MRRRRKASRAECGAAHPEPIHADQRGRQCVLTVLVDEQIQRMHDPLLDALDTDRVGDRHWLGDDLAGANVIDVTA